MCEHFTVHKHLHMLNSLPAISLPMKPAIPLDLRARREFPHFNPHNNPVNYTGQVLACLPRTDPIVYRHIKRAAQGVLGDNGKPGICLQVAAATSLEESWDHQQE